MRLLFIPFLLILLSFTSSDIDYSIMPENSIAIVVGDSDQLEVLAVEKSRYSSGSNLSKLSFKGIETTPKFKKGDALKIFARGGSVGQPMIFSIIKLEVDEKKRFATYNSVTGKRIKTVPCLIKEIDSKNKIFSVKPNEELEVGVYALIFKGVISGNFMMSMGPSLLKNPSVIEIIE